MYAQELQFTFQVCEKFYELTNIRHNITSAYHPQANGEVERFNRTTQEAFLKTQEFHDRVAQENTDWAKKLQSILFAYRIHKQASTRFSPFYMMYGREPLLPWQMENDLGPLDMSQEAPQVSIEEAIEKMENLRQQLLEVAAGNIKRLKHIKLKHTMPSMLEMILRLVQKCGRKIHCGTLNKNH